MKSVSITQIYNDKDGIPSIDFDVKMKSVHDPKGKFSIGFMIIRDDKKELRLAVFDDDRNIIGLFPDKKSAISFLDAIILQRKMRHRFIYTYPVTPAGTGYLVGVPTTAQLEHDVTKDIDGYKLSREVLETGIMPKEKTRKWRIEND